MKKSILLMGLASLIFTSCIIVRPGEVAVKQRLGKLKGKPKPKALLLLIHL